MPTWFNRSQVHDNHAPDQSSPVAITASSHRRRHSRLSRLQYDPLHGVNEIRVLELRNPVAAGSEQLFVPLLSLRHISLTSDTNYTAVSYKWGPPDRMEHLIIDNCVLTVRYGLEHMLVDLASGHQSRLVWIDAVCINQADVSERNAQVRLMGDIYRRASYVIAYLRSTDHVNYRKAYRSGQKRSRLSLNSTLACISRAVIHNDSTALKRGLDYTRFFNNDYFIRRWIVQELCLARSVIIWCDGYELPMGLLERYFIMFGRDHGYSDSLAANICQRRQQMIDAPLSLEDLLYEHEKYICQDRLDRVYALLSLSREGRRYISIDYLTTPMRLLLAVMHTAATHEGLEGARILSFACFLRRHLLVTDDEFHIAAFQANPDATDLQLTLQARVRGVLSQHQIQYEIEHGLNRLGRHMPSMQQYRSLQLHRIEGDEGGGLAYTFDGSNQAAANNDDGITVNGTNQRAFSCPVPNRVSGSSRRMLAGMSSAPYEINDEIWQFPRTPVAIVARRTESSCTLAARAFIISSNGWSRVEGDETILRLQNGRANLMDILDWTRDQVLDPEDETVRTIKVDRAGLLHLMKWADMPSG